MDLIERDDHLHLLDKIAAECFAGSGHAILVTGPVASGKTALLQAFAERQTQAGALVLSAACAVAEQSITCGVVGQLMHGATPPGDLAAEVDKLLAAATTHTTAGAEPELDPQLLRLFNTLCLRLVELSGQQPILIIVDDIQLADPASLAFLQQLVRRQRCARILVAFSDRGATNALSPLHAELRRHPHFHRVTTSPLTRGGVAELISRWLNEATSQRLASDFSAATGGNPLLLRALIHDYQALRDAEWPASGEDAPEYSLAFVSCLRRGGRTLLDVARALAVLGKDADPEHLAQIAQVDHDTVRRALREMNTIGLLNEGEFRHPAARSAVLEDIPPQERVAWYLRTANVLHETGADAPVVAAHLCQAGESPPAWAAVVLLEAAEYALTNGQTEQSVTYLKLALRTHPQPRQAVSIRARLAQTEWQLNPVLATRHLGTLIAALREGQLDRRDAVLLVRQLLWHGRTDQATEALELLRADTGAHPDPDALVELRALERWLAGTYPPLARRHPTAAGSGADDVVTPLVDPWLQTTALLVDELTHDGSREGVEHAHRALCELLLRRHTGWAEEAALAAIRVLARADRLDLAAGWCSRLAASADDGPTPMWQAVLDLARSEIALSEGDLLGAREHARAALTRVPAKSWGVAIGLPMANLILANARLGHLNEAAALLAQPVPDAMFHSRHGLHYLHARGHYHLATRHYHGALADFLSCGEFARSWGLDMAGLLPWRASAADAWLRLGNQDQARRLISDQLSRTGHGGGRHRALSLRLLAATAPANRRPQLLLESLELFEGCGDRFEQARTLADLSGAYQALEENRRARLVFRRALRLAKTCQAEPLYWELLATTDEADARCEDDCDTDRLKALTSSELRVASLAAIGYTNREIARKLYITASTVEQHLTRIYRKLNIKHRSELPTDLSRRSEHVARGGRGDGHRQPHRTKPSWGEPARLPMSRTNGPSPDSRSMSRRKEPRNDSVRTTGSDGALVP